MIRCRLAGFRAAPTAAAAGSSKSEQSLSAGPCPAAAAAPAAVGAGVVPSGAFDAAPPPFPCCTLGRPFPLPFSFFLPSAELAPPLGPCPAAVPAAAALDLRRLAAAGWGASWLSACSTLGFCQAEAAPHGGSERGEGMRASNQAIAQQLGWQAIRLPSICPPTCLPAAFPSRAAHYSVSYARQSKQAHKWPSLHPYCRATHKQTACPCPSTLA